MWPATATIRDKADGAYPRPEGRGFAPVSSVTFHPQIWHDNRALTSDETETYTVPIEAALDDNGELLEDDSRESDGLADNENAPERAQSWSKTDPYYVTIDGLR